MDDNAPQENPPSGFNKIDLTQLQGFSFGTQWTQDKSAGREARQDDRPRREGPDRRDDRGAPDRRDRRAFRKPATDGANAPAGGAAPAAPGADARAPQRDFSGGVRRGDFRGGPRRDGQGDEGGGRFAPQDRGPYDSPFFAATFYPEDTSFATLAKTILASCRTFELFDIAKTVIGKHDRFVAVLQRKAPEGAFGGQGSGPAQGKEDGKKPAPLGMSVPDGIPFESEEAAIAHVLGKHLGLFFDSAEVEIDPPKGNFQVVNRCGITGELLGPPNYHRYNQIVQQHYAARISRMPFDSFRAKIETVREPEVINQWVEKMKKTTRYTWKLSSAKPVVVAEAAAPVAPVTQEAPAGSEPAPADQAAAAPAAPVAAETPAALTFDSLEEARSYLLTNARDKVVRLVDNARFHGKLIDSIPQSEIRRAVEGTLERQQRFPLDTANALRGRLRREGFTIFKKGSKGVSYVCAVKRKFRVPGQVFADSISQLISFIEQHPMAKAGELHTKFLGLALPVAPTPEAIAAGTAPADVPLTPEQREKISRMQGDLVWLVREGYVTEFIDGRLFAAPAMVEARKKEIESTEHDPENFPDAPATPAVAPAPAPAPVDSGNAAPEATPAPSTESRPE